MTVFFLTPGSTTALRRLALAALAAVSLAGAAGCVHRIDIQQGNFLEPKDVERVTLGMTRVQVRALLGTPMLADPFQHERWDYLYYRKKGRTRAVERRHFIVYFDEQDKVARIERPSGAGQTASQAQTPVPTPVQTETSGT